MLLTEQYKDLLESKKFAPLSESDKGLMSILLNNTEKEMDQLIKESGSTTSDIAQFTPIMMPLVRRVYPQLIANELLGVQPMTMPTGFIYALVNRYTGTGEHYIKPVNQGMVIEVETGHGKNVGENIKDSTTNAEGTIVYIETGKTSDLLLVKLTDDKKFVPNNATDASAKKVVNVWTNEATFGKILKNYTGPVTTAAGEVLGKDMKEVGFSVEKKAVEVKTRKLKANYTLEMYEDLKAQHGLLADEELMSLMSAELQTEIDREVVAFVNNAATVVPDPFVPSNADGRWEIEKYRVQAIKIAQESRNIGLLTKRGQANVLLVSPRVATMLEQVGTFKFADSAANINAPIFNGVVGTFDNKYKVIVDQYATSDYITALYKGTDRRDNIGFFAPYVPLSFQKLVNPDSGQPSIVLRTRYALDSHPLNPEYFARTWGVDLSKTILG